MTRPAQWDGKINRGKVIDLGDRGSHMTRRTSPANGAAGPQSRQRLVTREQIIDAAIDLGDAGDLEAITVRRLASQLGVGTMTLYTYFRSKDDILNAMADRILGAFTIPDLTGKDLGSAVRALAHAYRRLMQEHPTVIRLLIMRDTSTPTAVKGGMEQILAALAKAAVTGELAVRVYGLVIMYSLGFSAYQAPRSWGAASADPELIRQRRRRLESFPLTDFPNVVTLAETVTTLPSEAQFEFGLDVLIEGLEAWQTRGSGR
jgi:AcrR family transcriptional regulator